MKKIINLLFVLCISILTSCNSNKTQKDGESTQSIIKEIRNEDQIKFEDFLKSNRQTFNQLKKGNELILVEEISKYEKELFELCNKIKFIDFIGVIKDLKVDETNEYMHYNPMRGMHLTFKIVTYEKAKDNTNPYAEVEPGASLDTSTVFVCDYVLEKNQMGIDNIAKQFKTLQEGDTVIFSGNILKSNSTNLYVTQNGCIASDMKGILTEDFYMDNKIALIISPTFAFDLQDLKKYDTNK